MAETTTRERVTSDHLAFALRMTAALAGDEQGTLCWSPMSVASALALAERGAAGATAAELRALLAGAPDADMTAHRDALAEAASLDEAPHADEAPALAVANTLWAREDIPLDERFATDLLASSGGAVRDAPFGTDPEGARRLVNDDVAETTRGLIPELLPPGAVDAGTIAAIVNALYLKTAWRNAFPDRATGDAPFHAAGGTYDTPTMRLTESFGYAHTGGWQAVTLPASGGVEATVLLPDGDLAAAEPRLDAAALAELLAATAKTKVDLSLPRFRVETSSPLTGVLAARGVETMFTDRADFSALSSERLKVSEVRHQAVLRIDEQGLEGAAATAVMMVLAAMVVEPDPIRVRVDRPFLFLVRHRATGVLYFLARVAAP